MSIEDDYWVQDDQPESLLEEAIRQTQVAIARKAASADIIIKAGALQILVNGAEREASDQRARRIEANRKRRK